MDNDSNTTAIIILILVILVGGLAAWWYHDMPKSIEQTGSGLATTTTISEEGHVRDTVTAFGNNMKMVSLTASSTGIVSAINQYYAPYVSTNLMAMWQSAPTTAPGRKTSSPWPDHINIINISKTSDTSYTVRAEVVEKTSVEETEGGSSDTYPISLIVENQNGSWKIVGFETTESMRGS
jgi:hypothetical protein